LFLLILGIGGISYQGVSPNGWLLRLLDSAWDRGPSYLFFTALGIVAGGTWLHKIMHRSPAIASGTGDAIAGGFIALGIFFCARFLYSGSL
jgi:hypothetical protein